MGAVLPDAALSRAILALRSDGDCYVCDQTLGPVDVALSVHHDPAVSPRVVLLPHHLACAAPTVLPGQDRRFVIPAVRHKGRAIARGGVTSIVLNPSIDIQVGEVRDGRWVPDFVADQDSWALTPWRNASRAPHVTWGLTMADQGRRVQLLTPQATHSVPVAGAPLLAPGQDVEIIVTDVVDIDALGRADGRPGAAGLLAMAAADFPGQVLTTLARVGGRPAERMTVTGSAADSIPTLTFPQHPGDRMLQTTDDWAQVAAQNEGTARLTIGFDPILNFAGLHLPPDQPVLLAERHTAAYGIHPDGSRGPNLLTDGAVSQGLTYLEIGTTPRPAPRWALHVTASRLSLTDAAGTTVFTSPAPPGTDQWLADAGPGPVAVLYGHMLGVRPGPRGAEPPALARRRSILELQHSSANGTAAWGLVPISRPASAAAARS